MTTVSQLMSAPAFDPESNLWYRTIVYVDEQNQPLADPIYVSAVDVDDLPNQHPSGHMSFAGLGLAAISGMQIGFTASGGNPWVTAGTGFVSFLGELSSPVRAALLDSIAGGLNELYFLGTAPPPSQNIVRIDGETRVYSLPSDNDFNQYYKIKLGTAVYNSITGNSEFIIADAGDDTIFSVENERATVDGGSDNDTLSYKNLSHFIDVDMAAGNAVDNAGAIKDVFINVENIIGTNFNDFISGHDGDNRLEGLEGSDQLYGEGGFDRLSGGAGNDHLYGGDNNDILYGGMGVDHLYGGDGNDVLHAGSGDVNPFNGAADVLVGGAGADTYVITRGEFGRIIIDDTDGTLLFDRQLIAGEAVYVGANQWTIRGHNAHRQGNDLVISGPGGEITLINFTSGDYGIALGEAPTDIGYFPTATNTVPDPNEVIQDDPSTPDVVEYAPQPDNLLEGTAANDNITSSMGSDTIRGEGGDDVLHGSSGFFTEIYGGIGNDWISAQSATTLEGNDGNDTISALLSGVLTEVYGGIGNDRISIGSGAAYGEDGHDYLFTMNGAVLIGGEGRDTISSNISDAEIRVDEDTDGDQVIVSGSNVTVYGGIGDDTIFATGTASGVELHGGADSDILFGSFGNDTIYGGTEDNRFGAALHAANDNCLDSGNGVLSDMRLVA